MTDTINVTYVGRRRLDQRTVYVYQQDGEDDVSMFSRKRHPAVFLIGGVGSRWRITLGDNAESWLRAGELDYLGHHDDSGCPLPIDCTVEWQIEDKAAHVAQVLKSKARKADRDEIGLLVEPIRNRYHSARTAAERRAILAIIIEAVTT